MVTKHAGVGSSASLIRRLPLFQELTPEHLQSVIANTNELKLPRGEILLQKGDPVRAFFVIVSGQIKLAFPSSTGNEKIVEVLGPGQSFGEALMFMDRPYPVLAAAVTDAVLLQIQKSSVLALLDRDPLFARAMLAGLAKRLHSLLQDVELYSVLSSSQRVVGYLLQQCAGTAGTPASVELPTSKSVIASRLNLTPETLSRVFHELSESGLIEVRGRRVTIKDLGRLRDYGG